MLAQHHVQPRRAALLRTDDEEVREPEGIANDDLPGVEQHVVDTAEEADGMPSHHIFSLLAGNSGHRHASVRERTSFVGLSDFPLLYLR